MTSLLIRSMFLLSLASTALAQELPKRDRSRDIDVEPRLMLNDLPDIPLPAPYTLGPTPSAAPQDVAKLEAELEKARKNAVWRERLSRSGVLSKVEAEQAALKVVRINRDLENARLAAMTSEVEEKRKRATAGEISKEVLIEAEAALTAAVATAKEAAAKWDAAQRAAAELRVQRERRLYAAGAGSRSSVQRAEAALQALAPSTNP